MIEKEEVIKIANLARLELTEAEIKKMGKDLSGILDYFNLLKKAKNNPKTGQVKKPGQMRKDRAIPQQEPVVKKLTESFPDKKGSHIKVKAVF